MLFPVPEIFVLGGLDVGRSYRIDSETVLGRGADAGIRLSGRSISRHHARIARDAGRWFIEDLGSTNGVSVDGKRIERHILEDLDEFKVGDLPLRFRAEVQVDDPDLAFEDGPAAPTAPAAPLPEDGGLELEDGGLELEAAPAAPVPAVQPAPALSPAMAEYQARRASILAEGAGRAGLFRGELSQQPLWIRALAYACVAGIFAGLLYLAVRLVTTLRGA